MVNHTVSVNASCLTHTGLHHGTGSAIFHEIMKDGKHFISTLFDGLVTDQIFAEIGVM